MSCGGEVTIKATLRLATIIQLRGISALNPVLSGVRPTIPYLYVGQGCGRHSSVDFHVLWEQHVLGVLHQADVIK